MRQPDINRVKKAAEHLKAAETVIRSIKWENITMLEDTFRTQALDLIQDSRSSLEDIINTQ